MYHTKKKPRNCEAFFNVRLWGLRFRPFGVEGLPQWGSAKQVMAGAQREPRLDEISGRSIHSVKNNRV